LDREALIRKASEDQLLQEAGRRRFLYRDVEELIESRFLTHSVDIGEIRVVFRTMLPSGYRWCKSVAKTNLDYTCWALACSAWVVDGLEIPPNSSAARRAIYKEWVRSLTLSEILTYEYVLTGLRNRQRRAQRLSEAYCYEPYSRGLWRLLGRPQEASDDPHVRRTWIAFNMAEDQNKRDAQEWDRTAVIVGSMSNKAAKHVTQSLEKREQSEKSRRQKVIENAVNWAIYGETVEEKLKVKVDGKTFEVPAIAAPTTLAELEDEMRKVMTGELDYHDQMVENHHRKIRAEVEKKRAEARRKQQEAARAREAAELAGGPSLVGYTPEQLRELNPRLTRAKTTGVQAHSSNDDRLYSRYVAPKVVPGVLTPDLKVVNAEAPEKNEPSLQEKIAKRNPRLRNG